MLVLDHSGLQARFLSLVEALEPEVVLELGCFEAEFSIACRSLLPHAEIHAFEANPEVYSRKVAKIERSGVQVHHLAIGDRVGQADFLIKRFANGEPISPKKGSNSLLVPHGDFGLDPVKVDMVTIDHFASQSGLLGRRTVLWIDLEGFAYQALLGGMQTLKSVEAMMIEVEDTERWAGQRLAPDVDELLSGQGFRADSRDQEYPRQHNVIYRTAAPGRERAART
jgi:FkbM family methyltransferase